MYSRVKHNLTLYNCMLMKIIREAKTTYYKKIFELNKYNIKNPCDFNVPFKLPHLDPGKRTHVTFELPF